MKLKFTTRFSLFYKKAEKLRIIHLVKIYGFELRYDTLVFDFFYINLLKVYFRRDVNFVYKLEKKKPYYHIQFVHVAIVFTVNHGLFS